MTWICLDHDLRGTGTDPQTLADALGLVIVCDDDAAESGGACWFATRGAAPVVLAEYRASGGTVSAWWAPRGPGRPPKIRRPPQAPRLWRNLAGLVMDTETADPICTIRGGAPIGDPSWHETTLYRTPCGRFFVAGHGGPRSMWGRPQPGGAATDGGGVEFVAPNAARDWMERARCGADDYARAGLDRDDE